MLIKFLYRDTLSIKLKRLPSDIYNLNMFLNRRPGGFSMEEHAKYKPVFTLKAYLEVIMASFILFSCSLVGPGLGDRVDISPPSLGINKANGDYVTGELSLGGDFEDDGTVESIIVSINGDVVSNYTAAINQAQSTWDVSIPTQDYPDGEKELVFVIKDQSGKTQETRILLNFDNHSPVVLVKNPQGFRGTVYNQDITIRGEAADRFRISSLEIRLFDIDGNTIMLVDPEGNLTESNTTEVDGTNAWSFTFRSEDYTLAEGIYSFQLTATDMAGNQSGYFYHYDDLLPLNGSTSFTVEELELLERTGTSTSLNFVRSDLLAYELLTLDLEINQALDLPQFVFDSPSVSSPSLAENPQAFGRVTDDDGVNVSTLRISLNGGPWEIPSQVPANNGPIASWSHDLSSLGEGVFTLQVAAEDIYGTYQESGVLDFVIDAAGPSLSITSPANGSYYNADFTVSGLTGDNLGVKRIEYSLDNGAYITAKTFDNDDSDGSVDFTVNAGTGIKEYSWSAAISLPADGSHMYRFRAVDMGDKVSSESLQVYVDTVLPVVKFITPQEQNMVNGTIRIQGTTTNQSPMESLTLTFSDGTYTETYLMDEGTNQFDSNMDLEALLTGSPDTGEASSFFSWYKNIDTTAFLDGDDRVLTITAEDVVGNINSLSILLDIDQTTDLPQIYFDNMDVNGTDEDNAFSGSPSLIGRVQDDDGVDITSLQVQIDGGAWEAPVITGSGRSINWSYSTASMTQGSYTIRVRADDIYGGQMNLSPVVPFILDTGAPDMEITQVLWGSQNLISDFQGAYVNDDVTVNGTSLDGIAVEYIEVNINNEVDGFGLPVYQPVYGFGAGEDPAPSVNWSLNLPLASYAQGDLSLKFRAKDLAGKASYKDLILIKDTTPPEVGYIDVYGTLARSNGLNGLLQFKGTASDENQVSLVQYAIIADDGSPDVSDVSALDWNNLTDKYSWETWVDSNDLGNGDFVLFSRAYDGAGNVSSDIDINANKYTFTIDSSTDLPTFSFSNLDAAGLAEDNLIGLEKVVLTGKVFDDDGIDRSSVRILLDNGTDRIDAPVVIAEPAEGLTEYSWSYTLPAEDPSSDPSNSTLAQSADAYTIVLTASDIGEENVEFSLVKAPLSSSSDGVSAYLDREAPQLSEDLVNSENLLISRTTVSLGGNASDVNELSSLTLSVDGGLPADITVAGDGSWTHSFPNSSDGTFVLVFTAKDAAGRSTSVTRNLLVDATPPAIPVVDAFSGTYQVDQLVASGSALDNESGLALVEYSLNNADWLPVTGTGSWFKTVNISLASSGLDQGNHNLYIQATDYAGNVSAAAVAPFTIDREDPELLVDPSYDGTVYRSGNFIINGSIDDSLSMGSDPVSISVTGPSGVVDLSSFPMVYNTVPDPDTWQQEIPVGLDGIYTLTIDASDSAGRTVSTTRTVAIDSTAPSFTSISLADNQLIRSSSLTLSGTVEDPLGSGVAAGVDAVSYRLLRGGVEVSSGTAAGTAAWNVGLASLSDSMDYTLELQVSDKAGNSSTLTTLNFDVDLTDPALTETGSGIGGIAIVYRNNDVALSGEASDGNGIQSLTAFYGKDGALPASPLTLTFDADGLDNIPGNADDDDWSATLAASLGEGSYEILIEALDNAGMSSRITRNIVIDQSTPVLSVSSPADGENVITSNYTIRGTVTDQGGAGVNSLQYSVDGGSNWQNMDTIAVNWSQGPLDFTATEGSKTLMVRASDSLNGYGIPVTVNFYHDNTAPNLSVNALPSMTNSSYSISGTASDGIALAEIRISASLDGVNQDLNGAAAGNDISTSSSPFSLTYTPGAGGDVADGQWIYSVTATDGAGNFTRETLSIKVDSTDPDAPVLSTPLSSYYQNTLNVDGSATDTGSGVYQVLYSINNSGIWTALNGGSSWFGNIDISGLAVGSYDIDFIARDWAGNESAPLGDTLVIDRADPVISPAGTWGADEYRLTGFTLSGTATDPDGTAISSVTASGGGAGASSGTDSWTVPVTPVTEGVNTISVTAIDGVGRPVTEEIQYFYDAAEPSFSSINLSEGQLLGATSYTLVGQADDGAGSGIASVQYNLNGGGWTSTGITGTDTWNLMLNSLSDGQNQTILFRAIDKAGRTMTTPLSRTFTVDTQVPVIKPEILVDRKAPYDFTDNDGTGFADGIIDENDGVVTITTNQAYGGDYAVFAFKVLTSDTNGINSVSINVPGIGDVAASYQGDGTGGEAGYEIWTTSSINTSALSDGTTEWTITVEDSSGLPSQASRTVLLDNSVPNIDHLSPRALTDVVNGDIKVKGLASDDFSGVASIEYKVGFNHSNQSWTAAGGSLFSWEIDFSGVNRIDVWAGQEAASVDPALNRIELPAHDLTENLPVWISAEDLPSGLDAAADYFVHVVDADHIELLNTSGGSTATFTTSGTALRISPDAKDLNNDLVWELPILIRATDAVGNKLTEDVSSYVIKVDPSGDKPRAAVVYPDPDNLNRTMGGIIRIFGTAEDDDAVSTVYMQVDANGDGLFDSNDDSYGTSTDNWFNSGAGLPVTGTYSWNYSLNESGEFNPITTSVSAVISGESYKIITPGDTDFISLYGAADNNAGTEFTASQNGSIAHGTGTVETLTRGINFRVRVKDIFGTDGPWTEVQHIDVDKSVPKIGSSQSLTLDNGVSQIPYIQDMWVKDDWTLTGTLEDESDISKIVISGNTAAAGTYTGSAAITASPYFADFSTANSDGYVMNLPVDTVAGATGELNITVQVFDMSTPQGENSLTLTIQYDNEAPQIANPYGGGIFGGSTPVEQSNRTYELKGTVNEDGSGLERVAFYFLRDAAMDRVYNPMEDDAGGANRTDVSAGDLSSDIYWLNLSGVTRGGDEYSLYHADVVGNRNVRKGGLIEIGGMIRLITEVPLDGSDNPTGTIRWADPVPLSATDASVAYAMVVDNDRIETPIWNGDVLDEIRNDDGDWLIESIEKSGGSYEWSAAIDSHNIPDGPIRICWVAFDKAGNAASGSIDTQVLNNRPRMAKVTLATDLNGDNDTDDPGEAVNPFTLSQDGVNQAVATAASDSFIAKGLTTVDLDIVGGNGALLYDLVYGPGADGDYRLDGGTIDPDNDDLILDSGNALDDPFGTGTDTLRATEGGPINSIQISTYDFMDTTGDTPDGSTTDIRIYIWDSTEETTARVNSQWAYLTLPLVVDVLDETPPVSGISPFYWNSEDDNSLYNNSRANGHIEIDGVAATGTDPDVSGQIRIMGHSFDDQRLSALWMRIGDGSNDFVFTGAGAAKNLFDVNGDGITESVGDNYYPVARYTPGSGWLGEDQWTANGWSFEILSDSLGQDGHYVEWQLNWDSSRIFGVAEQDIQIQVIAEDKRSNPNASVESAVQTSTDTAENATALIEGNSYRIESLGSTDFTLIGAESNTIGLTFIATGAGSGDGTAVVLTPLYQVDVVPYVTAVLRNKDNNLLPQYNTNRSRHGRYPVQRDEEGITIFGFNLEPSNVYIVNDKTAAINVGTNADEVDFDLTDAISTDSYDSFTIDTSQNPAATAIDIYSGWLRFSVNGIEAINNSNDNSQDYNLEDDLDSDVNNTLWSDDRYLEVWLVGDSFPNSSNPKHPSMAISDNGTLYGAWSNYVSAAAYTATEATRTQIFSIYDPPEWTDITVEGNTTPHTVYLQNYTDTGNNWGYLVVRDGNNTANIEHLGTEGTIDPTDGIDEYLYQFQNPRIVFHNNLNYVSYYDDYAKCLKYGVTNGNAETFVTDVGHRTDGATVIAGTEDNSLTPDNSWDAGLWSDIQIDAVGGTDVNAGDYRPVVVFYDTTAKTLKLARGNNNMPSQTSEWTIQNIIGINSFTGTYVSMKIDSSGNLHISAFKSSTGDLIYIYGANIDGTLVDASNDYTFTVTTIDSEGAVGTWTDMELDGTNPMVGYMNNSMLGTFDGIKVSFYDSSLGDWENHVIPAGSAVYDGRVSLVKDTGSNEWDYAMSYVSNDYAIVKHIPRR